MENFNQFLVDTNKINDNIKKFKTYRKGVKICAVVKADAYGHGISGVVKEIERSVDFFGVANYLEAKQVRLYSLKPILVLSLVEKLNIESCIKNDISLSVSSLKYLKQLCNISKKLGLKVKVHLKINTGMNRLGINNINKFKNILNYIYKNNNIIFEGIYTHFFNSTNLEFNEKQYKKFKEFLKYIKHRKSVIVHAASTNCALLKRKYCFDMVRLGLLMYGYSEVKTKINLEPCLVIKSKIIHITKVKSSEYVSYGNFQVKKPIKVACVSLGYADGLMRSYSKNGYVIINDSYAKIIGTICMDLFLVDITNINCKLGDDVIIIGRQKNKEITANDIAINCGTIPYEILTNFKKDRMDYKIIKS